MFVVLLPRSRTALTVPRTTTDLRRSERSRTVAPLLRGREHSPDHDRTTCDRTSMFALLDSRTNSDIMSMVVRCPGPVTPSLPERAAETFGYVTGEDARTLGVPMGTLNALARRGQLERIGHGIYRVPLIPPSRLDQYMLATLWPDRRGRISHESALDLYELSDVNPARIHVTVPVSYRTHREIPPLYVLHREDLEPEEQASFDGVPVVSAAKAIRQAHAQHLRRSLLEQAIDESAQTGRLGRQAADRLRTELLGRSGG